MTTSKTQTRKAFEILYDGKIFIINNIEGKKVGEISSFGLAMFIEDSEVQRVA
jgi:hypothetical protein